MLPIVDDCKSNSLARGDLNLAILNVPYKRRVEQCGYSKVAKKKNFSGL